MHNWLKTQMVPGNPQRGQVHPVCMCGWIIFSNNWIDAGLLNKQTTEVMSRPPLLSWSKQQISTAFWMSNYHILYFSVHWASKIKYFLRTCLYSTITFTFGLKSVSTSKQRLHTCPHDFYSQYSHYVDNMSSTVCLKLSFSIVAANGFRCLFTLTSPRKI